MQFQLADHLDPVNAWLMLCQSGFVWTLPLSSRAQPLVLGCDPYSQGVAVLCFNEGSRCLPVPCNLLGPELQTLGPWSCIAVLFFQFSSCYFPLGSCGLSHEYTVQGLVKDLRRIYMENLRLPLCDSLFLGFLTSIFSCYDNSEFQTLNPSA